MKLPILKTLFLLFISGVLSTHAADTTSRADAQKALHDLLANFWVGTATEGHFTAQSWGGAEAANALYAWWKIDGSSDAADRITAHWKWLKSQHPSADLIACGAHSSQNYASDDTAWNIGFMLRVYEVTQDPDALADAKGTLDTARARWWDNTFGGGYWYDDHKTGKSSYAAILVLDELTYYQDTGDKTYLDETTQDEAWIASHLLITPAQNTVSPAGDGLYFNSYSATAAKGAPGPGGSPYHMKVTNLAQSATMLVANMAMCVIDSRLFQITKNPVYKSRMLATAAGIRRTETNAGNTAPGALNSADVLTDDQDANVNGYEAIHYVLEVLPQLPADGTYADATVFKATAAAIMANDRLPNGFYGGDWQGPVNGVWTNNHNHSEPPHIVITASAINMVVAAAGVTAVAQKAPVTWVDPDTGHRVWRLTDEPNSSGLYFNLNAYTPDHKTLVYTAPDGIHALDLASRKTRLLIADGAGDKHVSVINAGYKTNSVFFTRAEPGDSPAHRQRAVCKIDVYTGQVTQLATLPPGTGTTTINADETLAAGTYEEGPVDPGVEYDGKPKPPIGRDGKPLVGSLVQPANKNEMITRRFAARIPMVLFTINLQTGKTTTLLHSTDWLDHLLFSPTDPGLLMYGHQGPWQSLDPLWLIHADGTGNGMVQKRQMAMEIAGHAFWAADGKTMWYDLQTPVSEDFWLAGYNSDTQLRTWYHLERDQWCGHSNVSDDGRLFCGEGGDPKLARGSGSKWIQLFRPEMLKVNGVNNPDLIQPGVLHSERLVNLSRHNYKQEPNPRFTPDNKMVIFTSNIFGPSYVFGVEVGKS